MDNEKRWQHRPVLRWMRLSERTSIASRWVRRLRLLTGLQSGMDRTATVTRIRSGVKLRGANLWILLCAAILASIGLNTSSAAVIIGAMLISPLMGPILGIGLGIAIHDRTMMFRAARTFGAAVVVSLATSTLYFWLTPITFPTPELLSRTSPTLLDVGVAFFGGVAGIIAGSRREATTAIPGVAIATALMPPLCTAGFGLANGNAAYFWGAIYLFTLNAVFISLATFLIVRLLGIPWVTYVDPAVERRVMRWIAVVVFAAIVPSVVLFYKTIIGIRHQSAAERFVRQQLELRGRKALSWNIETSDTATLLRVYLAGPPMPASYIDSLSNHLPEFGDQRSRLRVVQLNLPVTTESAVDPQELLVALRSAELQEELVRSMTKSMGPQNGPADSILIPRVRKEMFAAFPSVLDITYAEQRYSPADTNGVVTSQDTVRRDSVATADEAGDATKRIHIFLVRQVASLPPRAREELRDRMQMVVSLRLQPDSVRVLEIVETRQVRQ